MVQFRRDFEGTITGTEAGLWSALVEASGALNSVGPNDVDIEHVLTCIEDCELSFKAADRLWRKVWELTKGLPTVDEIHTFRQQLWGLRQKALDMICQTYGSPEANKVVNHYDPLFRLLEQQAGQHSTNVFTTNYDLAIEELVHSLPSRYELADGFVTVSDGREIWKSNYVPRCKSDHSLILWKLHGSTSWVGAPPVGEIMKTSPAAFVVGAKRTVLIYPTKRKRRSQRLFTRPFTAAYGEFTSMFLRYGAVRVLLAIGYRFGDAELKQALADGFEAEDGAVLVVVNPNATLGKVSAEFPSISSNRIKVVNRGFGEKETLEEIAQLLSAAL
jgi:hypothetical protein